MTEQNPSEVENKPRLIALYLPQFYPIPENDEWWGKGFTEWHNNVRGRPLYPGHFQPRLPADLGFYDLRLPEVREAQAELARAHGISGFCYYHYWFNGRRLLERPFNEVLESGKPDFPFCLCWANENWSRRWDGLDKEILMEQHYSEEDDREHIRWLAKAMQDPRYIRVDGKPLLIIYRLGNLPNPARTAEIWREEARKLGLGELYLCRMECFGEEEDPTQLGYDAGIEFPPHNVWYDVKPTLRPGRVFKENGFYSYARFVETKLEKPLPSFHRIPTIMPGYDNSCRRRNGSAVILEGANPQRYQNWMVDAIRKYSYRQPEENLVFINAWNEWGEGTVLEPDVKFGRGYLEATRNALQGLRAEIPLDEEIDASGFGFEDEIALLKSQALETSFLMADFEETKAFRDHLLANIAELKAYILSLESQQEADKQYIATLEANLQQKNSYITQLEEALAKGDGNKINRLAQAVQSKLGIRPKGKG